MSSRANLVAARLLRVPGAQRPAPTLLTYPGLRSKPWFDRSDSAFASWLPQLEAAAPEIRAEYDRVRASGRPSDYRVSESEHHAGTLHSAPDEWHWANFIDRGRVQSGLWSECPRTASALEAVPRLMVGDMPFAFAFFSTLKPRSRIAAHTAPANLRLRFHLCLRAPEPPAPAGDGARPACAMRVADETRVWEEGQCLVFDDSYDHEVWNDADAERAVLLFDTWHPDLKANEIKAIQQMFREVEGMAEARKSGQ